MRVAIVRSRTMAWKRQLHGITNRWKGFLRRLVLLKTRSSLLNRIARCSKAWERIEKFHYTRCVCSRGIRVQRWRMAPVNSLQFDIYTGRHSPPYGELRFIRRIVDIERQSQSRVIVVHRMPVDN